MHRLSPYSFFVLLSCASAALRPTPSDPARIDETALAAAVEDFYQAPTPGALREAVARAQKAGPDSALFHEIAALLAQLEGREEDSQLHLLAALRDFTSDSTLLHLHELTATEPTFKQRALIRQHLQMLAVEHPSELVRATATDALAALLSADDLEGRDAMVASIPGRVKLAWVGTWDNEQGKGFDLPLEPELRSDLDATYSGQLGPLTWRRDVPLDPRGRYDLLQLMTPTRWALAYAQGEFTVSTEGDFALALTTTDPLKVWVDGRQVFSEPQLGRGVFDHLLIPLHVAPGTHRILIKSAHREGAWSVGARLAPLPDGPAGASLDALLTWRVSQLPVFSARRLHHLTSWAHLTAGGSTTVKYADALAQRFPESIVARLWQIDALWFNQERGRTGDLLASLDASVGDDFAFVRLRKVRFLEQQGLKLKARETLLELMKSKPWASDAYDQLASHWRGEGWTEDELAALTEGYNRFGEGPDGPMARARALLRLGRRNEAVELITSLLAAQPFYPGALRQLVELRQAEGALPASEALLKRRLSSWPVDFTAWLSLADVYRRMGKRPQGEAAIAQASALSPHAALPYSRLGDLAYQAGDVSAAVKAWKKAVELHPEDEALANRVDFLSPEARGPWMADIPDEGRLSELVASRAQLRQQQGADSAYLLDHDVAVLNADGSVTRVVTLVIHAFNPQGRDGIIRQSVGQGRLRVLHAYSIDEKGQRAEASSERNRQIFFRGMQPGATLVLQYRLDAPPRGYLARHYTETWTFQGVGRQSEESTFVLWAPAATVLHEHTQGDVNRKLERRGDQVRIQWQALQVPPLVPEPSMPSAGELSANLRLSTVPDWKTWLSWEQALLEGAFRSSPQLEATARQLGEGGADAEEKLKRIHAYVMEEIRYQQDYESFIAGVKPHPAPMVLERRYGDCKDKAVLFIELAGLLGLKAHFALVRTRPMGPTDVDIPMQQFNHAIVYVPKQPQVSEGRFFDPTAELLDLDVVRADDVGTQALVFDPESGRHSFREIPFQGPQANREKTTLTLRLDESGGARGHMTLEAVGQGGSALRRTARNAEVFSQVAQRLVSQLLPNGKSQTPRAVEVNDLRRPAMVEMDVEAAGLARPEGDTLRLKLPSDTNPRGTFSLSERRHPLVLGAPQQSVTQLELTLPSHLGVKKLPASGTVALECLSLSRHVKLEDARVKSTETYETTCERISAKQYGEYRARLDEMLRLLDDELVLNVPRKAGRAISGVKADRR